MEALEAPTPFQNTKNQYKLLLSKKYQLKYEKDEYNLLIEIYTDDNIYFNLRKSNNLSLYSYMNNYNYNDITSKFLLHKDHYKDLTKVFHFFDLALINNKIKLELDQVKNIMLLKLNKILDFDEIECKIELNKNKMTKDDIINLLIDEINEIKNNKKEKIEENELINELKKENNEYENRIKYLEDKIKLLEDEINKFKEVINKIQFSKDNNKIEVNNLMKNNDNNFEKLEDDQQNDLKKGEQKKERPNDEDEDEDDDPFANKRDDDDSEDYGGRY